MQPGALAGVTSSRCLLTDCSNEDDEHHSKVLFTRQTVFAVDYNFSCLHQQLLNKHPNMWMSSGKLKKKLHSKIKLFYEWAFPEGSGSNIVRLTMQVFPMMEGVFFILGGRKQYGGTRSTLLDNKNRIDFFVQYPFNDLFARVKGNESFIHSSYFIV